MTTSGLTLDAGALTAAYHERDGGARAFVVVDVEGSDRGSWVIELPDGGEITVGRSRGATIVVDSEKVSRLHARVRRTGDRIEVADLESRNGTRVNGDKIDAPRALVAGDEVAIGPATLVVGLTSRAARPSAVVDADAFDARLAAELDRAMRYQRRVALAALVVRGDDAVIEAIGRAIRPMDLLGHLGGDQYALILPELSHDEATEALKHLVAAAAGLRAEVRVGLAVAPDDGLGADELFERARTALRKARAAGQLVVATPAPPVEHDDIVVLDPAMRRVYATVERIADSHLTVLILGETGVGKELVAEAIHQRSSRRDGPMVKLNCASLPETLLESALFGHERGAFTGAERRQIGFFEAASGGTLFLDELGEMQPPLQAKLLRVLERKTVTRVGGTDEIPVDVRVVAATHRDLGADVRAGRFREDLFFRVAGFTVVVPPLRDRRSEIVPIAERVLRQIADELGQPPPQLGADAVLALGSYDWPGNVRELRNAIERAIVLHSGGTISADDLPDQVRSAARRAHPPPAAGASGSIRATLAEIERASIVEALELHGGNQTQAARRLGISRRALIYKMERLGLKPPPGAR